MSLGFCFCVLQLVAGSVVMAFEEVCPDRIDLIHKNYRKLCNLLVDVEEWGQVVIISMLTRYARTQFVSPWKEVSNTLSIDNYFFCWPDELVFFWGGGTCKLKFRAQLLSAQKNWVILFLHEA